MSVNTAEATLEELYQYGREARERLDAGRWIIGDLATEILVRYGLDDVGEFAREVGLGRKTVQEYRRMANFFDPAARADFLAMHPNVFYSHMRLAKRLGAVKLAYEFLELVALNTWSVDEAEWHLLNDDPWASLVNPPVDDELDPALIVIIKQIPVHMQPIGRNGGHTYVTFEIEAAYGDMLNEEVVHGKKNHVLTLERL